MMQQRLQNVLLICFSCFMFGLFLFTVFSRIGYPYDLEWMEGGVLLHVYQVLHGQPLYPYPSEEYIPFIYPPLYYWLVAIVAWATELDYFSGRILSILGALFSVWALVRALRLENVSWPIALCGGSLFLSTYEDSGAFLDIVRADGVLLALMTWSLVWVREDKIRLGAFSLALAFATKHNAAIMGIPMGLWLWQHKGIKEALLFALWSAIPALFFVAYMQWSTQGLFLVYLLKVPAHHPFVLGRLTWLASFEIFVSQYLFVLVGLLWLCVCLIRQEKKGWSSWLGMFGCVLIMVLLLFSNTIDQWCRNIAIDGIAPNDVAQNMKGIILCIGITCTALGIRNFSCVSRYSYWVFCGVVAWFFSGIMRGHHGGYLNVLLPGMWACALACGFLLDTLWKMSQQHYRWSLLGLVAAQLYSASWNISNLVPTQEDVEAGDTLISSLKEIEKPVFSPHAPWYPVLAGHPPSAHLIALWDIEHTGGPLADYVHVIEQAIEERRFGAILLANDKEDHGRKKYYPFLTKVNYSSKKVFFPKKGWQVRPSNLYFPTKK